jgi:hypothetical protein
MKVISQLQIFGRGWIGLLACLVLSGMGGVMFAQGLAPTGDVSPQASGSSTTLQTFEKEQFALAQEHQALISQGATQQQLEAWRQQNAARFQAQQQLAQALALASALQPMRVNQQTSIPANASGALKDFLTARASLANASAQIYNQLLQDMPANPTQEQVGAMRQQANQAFQEQYAGALQLQAQQAQTITAQSEARPMPVLDSAFMPPNATPQLRAFLAARNALASSAAQVWNQYLGANAAARQAAMLQWSQQNAAGLRQLPASAENLTTSPAGTPAQEGTTQ